MDKKKRMKGFHIVPDFSYTARRLECSKNDPVYEEIKRLWFEQKQEFLQKISPEVYMTKGSAQHKGSESECWYALFYLGAEFYVCMDQLEDSFFLKILMESLADECIVQMKEQFFVRLEEELERDGLFLMEELEYPRDITEEEEKTVITAVKKEFSQIREEEEKLSAAVLLTAEVPVTSGGGRQVMIEVLYLDKAYDIAVREGKSLLEEMECSGLPVKCGCGGDGTCGDCKIQVDYGGLPVTAFDYEAFAQEELEAGFRLACQAFPEKFCTVILPE